MLDQVKAPEDQNEFEKAKEKPTQLPYGFSLEKDGVYYEDPNDEKESRVWICGALEVISYQSDVDSKNWGIQLKFTNDDGHTHFWSMPKSMLSGNGEKYREQLLNMGLNISHTSKGRNLLSQYLNNCKPSKRATSVEKVGWYKDVYVLPGKTFGKLPENESVIYQSTSSSNLGFVNHGNLIHWNAQIGKYAVGNSRLIFAVSLALAGTLMRDLNVTGGGFHVVGGSSIGKSTINHVAVSVWGDRSRFKTWRTTDNALEEVALVHNDNTLILDEIGEADRLKMDNTVYMLANGQGKERSNKGFENRETKTWRLLFLSNGEIDLRSMMQSIGKSPKDGQTLRIANIPADTGKFGVFENLHEFSNGSQLADHLKEKAEYHHGSLGMEFIEKYIENHSRNKEQAKFFYDEFRNRIEIGSDSQVSRVLSRFALVAAAGELAYELGLVSWEPDDAMKAISECFKAWLEDRGSGNTEAEEALNLVKSFIERNEEGRFEALQTNAQPLSGKPAFVANVIRDRAGFKHHENRQDVYYIYPETFKNEVCKGISYKMALSELQEKGFLKHDADRFDCKLPSNTTKKRPRMYAILGELLGETDD
ncbi:DUF927 domain-containing protein [Thiomicrorhabdus sp. 6S2-11]|uniref:DUF927 domain-containing protein n=1 Tax=Thiomicrorhabdus marina TaxID=2818442 RepID=A0ABS3Q465_9GAMM|nr:DUF927 domain-containing protein [Thiomicrorhabdus marina]MBO1927119.1 DUF927 domain-containing protein [Thiomicrorhabdus marina]